MDDLIAFLRARLDDDERIAQQARGAEWHDGCPQAIEHDECGCWIVENRPATGRVIVVGGESGGVLEAADAQHMIQQDPKRVLADVAAKREIIEAHPSGRDHHEGQDYCLECGPSWNGNQPRGYPCTTIRLLALPYAGHPDYQESWKP